MVTEHDLDVGALNRSRGGQSVALMWLLAFADAQLLGGPELVADVVGPMKHLSGAGMAIRGEEGVLTLRQNLEQLVWRCRGPSL